MNTQRKYLQIYINFYISNLLGLSNFTPSILCKIFCSDKTRVNTKKKEQKKLSFSAYVEFLILKRIRGAHTRMQA